MTKNAYKVVGVMSGTSLDGIDLACCTFKKNSKWEFEINCAETYPYSSTWRDDLRDAINLDKDSLQVLDAEYSNYLGDVVKSFMAKHHITDLDFVASHGHTVWHRPDLGYTFQIGNRQELADTCGLKVICDFRTQDVNLGGQGAPLVPIGDKLLFQDYEFCLNLGGFANVSFEKNGERLAFDICPANLVLNYFVSERHLDFDDRGKLAASGQLHGPLLDQLNAIPFYNMAPPKSLGLEWVKEHFFPVVESYNLAMEDVLRTLVEHIAIQISRVIKKEKTKTLITGGGAFNTFLISRIKHFSSTEIVLPNPKVINFKEALIFGFLGVLRERNETNCLKSVTGARQDHCSGMVLKPKH
ncbi:anhydro-N-acetylmuramic acid kinase [uncultured Winogradskyella sp.]|uniref:anhydro-N-acetylmuramic acid kinase n=1 Tax=uncultured Winogradskyella sp. TaxID=395353 RepID=UPI0035147BE6